MGGPRRAFLLRIGAVPLSSHDAAKPRPGRSSFGSQTCETGRQALRGPSRPGPLERYEPSAAAASSLKQALGGRCSTLRHYRAVRGALTPCQVLSVRMQAISASAEVGTSSEPHDGPLEPYVDADESAEPSVRVPGCTQSHCQHLHVDRLIATAHFNALGSGAGMVGGDEGVKVRSEHNNTG